MKKIISVLIAIMLIVQLFGLTAYADENNINKYIDRINSTDQSINNEIDKAIDDANNLILKYVDKLINTVSDSNADSLQQYIDVINKELSIISDTNSDSKEIQQKIEKIMEEMDKLKLNIASGKDNAEAIQNKSDKLYEDFSSDMDKVISHLIQTTNNKTEKLVSDCAKDGIIINTYFIEVKIGGELILVDPLVSRG